MIKIDVDNFHEYPVGTKLYFNFGAYYPVCEGVVTGVVVKPETKHFPVTVALLAEYVDPETNAKNKIEVQNIVSNGIGTYLCPKDEQPEAKPAKKSPWAWNNE